MVGHLPALPSRRLPKVDGVDDTDPLAGALRAGGQDPVIFLLLRGDAAAMGRNGGTPLRDDPAEQRRWQSSLRRTRRCDRSPWPSAAVRTRVPDRAPVLGAIHDRAGPGDRRGPVPLGIPVDGIGGCADERVPTARDLSLAVGYAGLDPMRDPAVAERGGDGRALGGARSPPTKARQGGRRPRARRAGRELVRGRTSSPSSGTTGAGSARSCSRRARLTGESARASRPRPRPHPPRSRRPAAPRRPRPRSLALLGGPGADPLPRAPGPGSGSRGRAAPRACGRASSRCRPRRSACRTRTGTAGGHGGRPGRRGPARERHRVARRRVDRVDGGQAGRPMVGVVHAAVARGTASRGRWRGPRPGRRSGSRGRAARAGRGRWRGRRRLVEERDAGVADDGGGGPLLAPRGGPPAPAGRVRVLAARRRRSVQQTSQPAEPASIQRAAVAAGPKSASSGWAAMTMNRAGRQVWARLRLGHRSLRPCGLMRNCAGPAAATIRPRLRSSPPTSEASLHVRDRRPPRAPAAGARRGPQDLRGVALRP